MEQKLSQSNHIHTNEVESPTWISWLKKKYVESLLDTLKPKN